MILKRWPCSDTPKKSTCRLQKATAQQLHTQRSRGGRQRHPQKDRHTHSLPFQRDRSPHHPKDDPGRPDTRFPSSPEGSILPEGWTRTPRPLAPGEDAQRAAGRPLLPLLSQPVPAQPAGVGWKRLSGSGWAALQLQGWAESQSSSCRPEPPWAPRRPREREGPANRRPPPGLALWPRPCSGRPASRFPGPPPRQSDRPLTWQLARWSPWSLPGEGGTGDGARGSQGTELPARKSQLLSQGPLLCHSHLLVRVTVMGWGAGELPPSCCPLSSSQIVPSSKGTDCLAFQTLGQCWLHTGVSCTVLMAKILCPQSATSQALSSASDNTVTPWECHCS